MKPLYPVLLLILLFMFSSCNNDKGLIYIYDDSSFGTFEIIEDNVYQYNSITIKNNDDVSHSFKMSIESVDGDLVSSENLVAFHKDDLSIDLFAIDANETKTFIVAFVGTHGTDNQKNDRLPPNEINFSLVE